MLLGNKSDLPNKEVTSEEGLEYAKSNGFGFLEVSAKSDINIEAAFKSLISNIYSQVNKKHNIQNPNVVQLQNTPQSNDPKQKEKKDGCCK